MVQGFDCLGTNRNPPCRTMECRSGQHLVTLAISNLVGVVNLDVAKVHTGDLVKPTSMEVVSNSDAQMDDRHVFGIDTTSPQKQIPNFEAMIRDIDEAINTKPDFLNSKVHNLDSSLAMIGKDLHFRNNEGIIEDLGSHT